MVYIYMKNNQNAKIGYYAMGAFALVGFLSLLKQDYATAAMNIAIGIALGGSSQKPWEEQSLVMKSITCSLLLIALALFVYIIVTDLKN
jgi:cell division protein FtsW (lipid II flippase)